MTVVVKSGDFPTVPSTLPVSALLQGCEELPGGISKEEFIGRFCRRIEGKEDYWNYPNPEIGSFLADGAGKPVKDTITLGPGTLIDRFGTDDTRYFAPLGTPYTMRSLPPCVLGLPYVVWRVLKPLEVEAGPIAPGFLQKGLGTQYVAKESAAELAKRNMIEKVGPEEVLKLYQQAQN